MTSTESTYLQIGEAAERTGLTQRTLRYYEEKGLLDAPARMEGGFRLYGDSDIERIERIKQLRDLLGFSLAEIKEMIQFEDIRLQIRADWNREADSSEKAAKISEARHATRHQLTLVNQKIARMREMHDTLKERITRYDAWLARYESESGEPG